MMTVEPQKDASCVELSVDIRLDVGDYVKERLAERRGVFSSEIANTDEVTNIQAHDLMADAERYFGFKHYLHKSTFLEKRSHFTVLQCIKLIRFQLGGFDFLSNYIGITREEMKQAESVLQKDYKNL